MSNLKIFLLTISIILLSGIAFAQPPGGQGGMYQRGEKIKAMKVEFITSKLELTPEEAQKFWPVYNEFIEKMHQLQRSRRQLMKENKSKKLTDAEINNLIAVNFDTDQKMLDLKREYDVKFKQVLSIQKVGKLYRAEQQFKHELLRRMKGVGGPPVK